MPQQTYDHEPMRRYLLGALPEEEWQQLEERLLTDDEYYDELLLVEEDLIDQYVAGDLAGEDRERFERRFLTSPERRQKLSFAMAFNRYVAAEGADLAEPTGEPRETGHALRSPSGSPRPRSPVPIFVLAALVLVASVAAWLALRDGQQPGSPILSATLRPGLTRGPGDVTRIALPGQTGVVELKLEIGTGEYKEYRAAILTDSGPEVYRGTSSNVETAAGNRLVVFSVPANVLKIGDYQLKLTEVSGGGEAEDLGKYFFRVTN